MREGEAPLCSECHAPIPASRGKCARTCSPDCRHDRDLRLKRERKRLKRERNMGTAPGHGAPSPSPRGSPPTCHSRAESTAERYLSHANGKRPPPEPEPPAEPPLPINDPTRELRRRLLAEAEALLSLAHVEGVSISVRDGTVTSLRSTWDVRDCGDHYEATPAPAAGTYGERRGYHNPRGADLDFGGAP